MARRAAEREEVARQAHEEAKALVIEELDMLYSKRIFGRVEVHTDRGRIALIRTVADKKIA